MIIAADLDGTLSESKMPISVEMADTLSAWLKEHQFAIISGGELKQFQTQVVSLLPEGTHLDNLYLFPTNGASCYHYENSGWQCVYREPLSEQEKESISKAFKTALAQANIATEQLYGDQIAFRGGQVTFSALGQEAPLSLKALWDPQQTTRKSIVSHLIPLLPEFSISIGGTTSIDVTKKGIDKAYAIGKLKELLDIDAEAITFLGDALFEGGNDFSATRTGATCIKISGPADTIHIIKEKIKKGKEFFPLVC